MTGYLLRTSQFLAMVTLFGLLAACGTLPSSGPLSDELEAQANLQSEAEEFPFEFFDLRGDVIGILKTYTQPGLGTKFPGRQQPPRHIVGEGDLLSVVVWEPSEVGLFSRSQQGGGTELGPFVVDQTGKITVPYVGRLTVANKQVHKVQETIRIALQGKAVDPQVVVSVREGSSSQVVVSGDVNKPGQYPLAVRGETLLEVLAKAGGSKARASETIITLVRGNKHGSQLLEKVYEIQTENVFIRPRDQIYLTHKPQTFTAFGAVGKVGEYPIQANEVSLIEALGRVGGLHDGRADSVGVFVFRFEQPSVVRKLNPNLTVSDNVSVPVIYRLNMREARAYFNAQAFEIRDKDIIYVANARSAELNKFLQLLRGMSGLTRDISAL